MAAHHTGFRSLLRRATLVAAAFVALGPLRASLPFACTSFVRAVGPLRASLPFACTSFVLAVAGCGSLRQVACLPTADATLLMDDLMAGAAASKLKNTTEAPRRTAITYKVASRDRAGDLYQSGTPSAAIVMVPGASTSGKDDPRLVAFAEALARMRFTVLVPDIPNVRQLRVKPDDAAVIADGFTYLAGRSDLAPQGRVGMGAFSYALGPTVIAALEPEVREKVRFVLGVGGYYNLVDTITYFTTGYYREAGGPLQYLQPNWYGKWVFVHSNVDRFPDAEDRQTLTEMANQKVKDPAVDVSALAARLRSPEGKALYEMLTNTDPAKVPGYLQGLPADVRADLDTLDLSKRDLRQLKARVLLFHGYDDNLVPYTESLAFAQATGGAARTFLINGFVHVDFAKTGFVDGWRMGCAIEELLAERWR